MNRESVKVRNELITRWDEIREVIGRLTTIANMSPSDGWTIFQPRESEVAGTVQFDVMPITFNMPERADDSSAKLYIVVRGRLTLRRSSDDGKDRLLTNHFATEVGYFRQSKSNIHHVYGAHYDFTPNENGHPAFHAQMKSFSDFIGFARENFELVGDVEDRIAGILKTVRLPTAQMDVFSFILQMCADHLISPESAQEETVAFKEMVAASRFLQGAALQVARLNSDEARYCYRSSHWYPA